MLSSNLGQNNGTKIDLPACACVVRGHTAMEESLAGGKAQFHPEPASRFHNPSSPMTGLSPTSVFDFDLLSKVHPLSARRPAGGFMISTGCTDTFDWRPRCGGIVRTSFGGLLAVLIGR